MSPPAHEPGGLNGPEYNRAENGSIKEIGDPQTGTRLESPRLKREPAAVAWPTRNQIMTGEEPFIEVAPALRHEPWVAGAAAVEDPGGLFALKSVPGKDTTFRVSLPHSGLGSAPSAFATSGFPPRTCPGCSP